MKSILLLLLTVVSIACHAQKDTVADLSKMGHFKLRAYLKENGLKTASAMWSRSGTN